MLALKLWKVRFCNYGLVRWEIYFNPLFEQTNEPTLVKFSMIMILLETNKELLETRRTEMSMVFQSLVSSTQNDS
jgi:ABC-type proline/glycine betaine transport system ATPase subunit